MRELVFATHNRHKVLELRALFHTLSIPLKSLDDFPPFTPPDEDGKTYAENAIRKATYAAQRLKLFCLADDSGLEVDALNGRPGILSARYAPTNPERIARLLRELEGVPLEKRTARFVCSVALATPSGNVIVKTGFCKGCIISDIRGKNGFGYDPVFLLPAQGKTMAELTLDEKNRVSHRSCAARMLIPCARQKSEKS